MWREGRKYAMEKERERERRDSATVSVQCMSWMLSDNRPPVEIHV